MSPQKEIPTIEKIQLLVRLGIDAASLLKYTDLFIKYQGDLEIIPLDRRTFQMCLEMLRLVFNPKNWPAIIQATSDGPTKIDHRDLTQLKPRIEEVGNPLEIKERYFEGLTWLITSQVCNVHFPVYFELSKNTDPKKNRPDLPYSANIVLPLIDLQEVPANQAKTIEAKIRQRFGAEIKALEEEGYFLLTEAETYIVFRSNLWSPTLPTISDGLERLMSAFSIMATLGSDLRALFPELGDAAFHYYLD